MDEELSVAAIAKALTPAQQEAVLALHGSAWRTWSEGRLRMMLDGLGKHGLNQLRDAGLARKGPPWALTLRGIAVRDHLLAPPHLTPAQ